MQISFPRLLIAMKTPKLKNRMEMLKRRPGTSQTMRFSIVVCLSGGQNQGQVRDIYHRSKLIWSSLSIGFYGQEFIGF